MNIDIVLAKAHTEYARNISTFLLAIYKNRRRTESDTTLKDGDIPLWCKKGTYHRYSFSREFNGLSVTREFECVDILGNGAIWGGTPLPADSLTQITYHDKEEYIVLWFEKIIPLWETKTHQVRKDSCKVPYKVYQDLINHYNVDLSDWDQTNTISVSVSRNSIFTDWVAADETAIRECITVESKVWEEAMFEVMRGRAS